jgi:hypothetical protein
MMFKYWDLEKASGNSILPTHISIAFAPGWTKCLVSWVGRRFQTATKLLEFSRTLAQRRGPTPSWLIKHFVHPGAKAMAASSTTSLWRKGKNTSRQTKEMESDSKCSYRYLFGKLQLLNHTIKVSRLEPTVWVKVVHL